MSVFDKFKLDNQVAIVTGGASGLGKAMGKGLAEAGANLVIADINLELAKETAAEFENETGNKAIACKVDVTSISDVEQMVTDVVLIFYLIRQVLMNMLNLKICHTIVG